MRELCPILLMSLLLAVIVPPAYSTDARFFGEFSLQGWYEKNHSLLDKHGGTPPNSTLRNRGSTAFYTQRLRMGVDMHMAKGLMLGTRFDALDRKWMAARVPLPTSTTLRSSTDSEQENIGMEVGYILFDTPIGRWLAGVHTGGSTYSTGFGGVTNSINWTYSSGAWLVTVMAKKGAEPTEIGAGTDCDSDTYSLVGQYKWNTGSMYFRFSDVHGRTNNSLPTSSYTTDWYVYIPIFKQKFNTVYFEWEINYVTGWSKKYNDAPPAGKTNVKADKGMNSRMKVDIDLAPANVGAYFVYSRGDNPKTLDKAEGNFRELLDYDRSFNPCLLLWNEDYMHWLGGDTEGTANTGTLSGNTGTKGIKTYFDNVWMYQIYGNYKMTPALNIGASYTYAYADKKPTLDMTKPVSASNPVFASDKIGSELDLIIKYRIYDNLEYMIGAAYLWTGDYFKGTNPHAKLSNNYLLTHKLTLSF